MKGAWGETPLSYNFFQNPLIKTDTPPWVSPQVKLKPPYLKNTLPPIEK